MALPNFLLIGAAKSGTTSLCSLLGQHPDVFMHPQKELDFFCFDENHAKGMDWYFEKFADAGGCSAVGEGSPNYAKRARYPGTAGRIAEHLPDVKLLYIVRHPLRRMESAWLHALRSGHRRAGTFAQTVRKFPEYVDTSDYAAQLAVYREHFPVDQILTLFFEDYQAEPRDVVRRTFEFLGVDPRFEVDGAGEIKNPSVGRRIKSPWRRRMARIPGFQWIRTEVDERPSWDEPTRAWVRERLEAGTSRFLEENGRSAGFWDWTDG